MGTGISIKASRADRQRAQQVQHPQQFLPAEHPCFLPALRACGIEPVFLGGGLALRATRSDVEVTEKIREQVMQNRQALLNEMLVGWASGAKEEA